MGPGMSDPTTVIPVSTTASSATQTRRDPQEPRNPDGEGKGFKTALLRRYVIDGGIQMPFIEPTEIISTYSRDFTRSGKKNRERKCRAHYLGEPREPLIFLTQGSGFIIINPYKSNSHQPISSTDERRSNLHRTRLCPICNSGFA